MFNGDLQVYWDRYQVKRGVKSEWNIKQKEMKGLLQSLSPPPQNADWNSGEMITVHRIFLELHSETGLERSPEQLK